MNVAIILAGGTGLRLNNKNPKQFIKIKNKPILLHTLDVFESCIQINKILVVVHQRYKDETINLVRRSGFKKKVDIIEGGETRQESSYNALRYLNGKNADIVLIHDAVRPLVSEELINRSIAAAKKYGAVDVVVKATDTIVHARDGFIVDIPNRENYYYGQTPQTFKYDLMWKAHNKAKKEGFTRTSDDAKLVLRLGHKVKIVEGSYENIKLTNLSDLLLLQTILKKK